MDNNILLNQIAESIKTIKNKLDVIETKVELVNKRVEQSQDETISALSELINEGYNLHEKRIKKIEEQLHSPQSQ